METFSLNWWQNLIMILASGFWGTLIFVFPWKRKLHRLKQETRLYVKKRMKETRSRYFRYDRVELFLLGHGAVYLTGGVLTPEMFLEIKISFGLLLLAAIAQIWWPLFPVGFAAGFFLPETVLKISNSSDNERMLPDIKNIYDTLRIQTRAGVFLTYSLSECYLVVSNARLKTALLELNNQILAKSDVETAIDEFQMKFENEYMDTLCIVIRQSMESGRSVQILQDLSVQLVDVEHAMALKKRERLDRKIQLLQMLLFLGMLAVCIYGLGAEIGNSMRQF